MYSLKLQPPIKSKSKNRSHTSNISWHRVYTVVPKHRERSMHSEEIQDKSKTSWINCKLCVSMSDVKTLFKSPTPFSFVDCDILLSLGLVLLPASSFPWQVSHNSSILESPRQPRLLLHSFTQWPLWASIQGHP